MTTTEQVAAALLALPQGVQDEAIGRLTRLLNESRWADVAAALLGAYLRLAAGA